MKFQAKLVPDRNAFAICVPCQSYTTYHIYQVLEATVETASDCGTLCYDYRNIGFRRVGPNKTSKVRSARCIVWKADSNARGIN